MGVSSNENMHHIAGKRYSIARELLLIVTNIFMNLTSWIADAVNRIAKQLRNNEKRITGRSA